jgi:hypothetical protein
MSLRDYHKCRFCQWENGKKGKSVSYFSGWNDRHMLYAVLVGIALGLIIGILI